MTLPILLIVARLFRAWLAAKCQKQKFSQINDAMHFAC